MMFVSGCAMNLMPTQEVARPARPNAVLKWSKAESLERAQPDVSMNGWKPIAGNKSELQEVENFPMTDARYWRQRLIQRRYHFPATGDFDGNLAARIEHAGAGNFFPLNTADEDAGATKAQRIYEAVVERGWEAVFRQFSRELIVNFEWNSNPI